MFSFVSCFENRYLTLNLHLYVLIVIFTVLNLFKINYANYVNLDRYKIKVTVENVI